MLQVFPAPMEFPASLPTEIVALHPKRSLGQLYLEGMPQPGSHVEVYGACYTVLERRHCYQWRRGRYELQKIAIYVQSLPGSEDRTLLPDGTWAIGDPTCRFNARSGILRCAVKPGGPCQGCAHWEPCDPRDPTG